LFRWWHRIEGVGDGISVMRHRSTWTWCDPFNTRCLLWNCCQHVATQTRLKPHPSAASLLLDNKRVKRHYYCHHQPSHHHLTIEPCVPNFGGKQPKDRLSSHRIRMCSLCIPACISRQVFNHRQAKNSSKINMWIAPAIVFYFPRSVPNRKSRTLCKPELCLVPSRCFPTIYVVQYPAILKGY
jgi:hypothetical protein